MPIKPVLNVKNNAAIIKRATRNSILTSPIVIEENIKRLELMLAKRKKY